MVSVLTNTNQLILRQIKTGEKSNEITAIPALLDLLELKNCTITIDAIRCQKNIAKKRIKEDTSIKKDIGCSRIKIREYYLETSIDWLSQKTDWVGLNATGMVKSKVFKKGV